MLLLQALDSEDYSGWADYAAFIAARADAPAPNVYASYYGSYTADANTDLDTTKVFDGNPSLRMTFRASPNAAHGWYSYDYDTDPDPPPTRQYRGVYVRDRFELASTFIPTGADPWSGLHFANFDVRGENGGTYVDNVRVILNDAEVRLQYYRSDTDTFTTEVIGASADWRGAPKQVVMLVTPVVDTATIRARVYFGEAADSLEELVLIGDEVFTASASMNATTNRPTATPSGIYRWDWLFTRPTSDAFRMWSYTSEFGWGEELDAIGQIAVNERVAARTSREVPLLVDYHAENFDRTDFNENRGWMFSIGGDGTFVTTRPYSGGKNALLVRTRISPPTTSSYSSTFPTVPSATITSWYVRQTFEMASTFAPSMNPSGVVEGLRLSQISLAPTTGSSEFSRSYVTANDGNIKHVWSVYPYTSDVVTTIDTIANWKAEPYQFVHWVERITSTTWRVRIWAGTASPGYRELELLYDVVHTAYQADSILYTVGMWSPWDLSEAPASNDLDMWIFAVEQGIPDYFSDPSTEFAETLAYTLNVSSGITLDKTAVATLTSALTLGDSALREYVAQALMVEQALITDTTALRASYGQVVQDTTLARDRLRVAERTALAEACTVATTLVPARAVRVADAVAMIAALAAPGKYGRTAIEVLQLRETLTRAIGAQHDDVLVVLDALTQRTALRAALTETTLLAEALQYTAVFHLEVSEELATADTVSMQQLFSVMVTEQVRVLGSTLIPGTQCLTWAVNARTGATTEYRDYTFNSFARRGTRYLAAADDGLYVLDGDTDNGSAIIAELASGFLQFAGTRFASFKAVYLGMHATGNVFFRLTTGDDKTYTYRVVAQSMENTKVRVGKGLRSRYFAFALETTGQDFDLDTIEFLPLGAQRRV